MATATLTIPRYVDLVGKCYFCGKTVGNEAFCFGCGEFVCEECDETGVAGKHKVEDHKEIENEQ